MSATLPNSVRDAAVTAFRQVILEKMGITPLVHQAKLWGAADGVLVLDEPIPEGSAGGVKVMLPSGVIATYACIPRPHGRARVLTLLSSFKGGKSLASGLFAASFGCIPGGQISILGSEYSMCGPEFDYLSEALLSDRGLGLKYRSYQNRPKDGRMFLELENGCRFDVKSYERSDALRGKEWDLFLVVEAYQMPGSECFTDVSQNLRAREGYTVFSSTPDRPWLKELHTVAHSGQPEFATWECICGVPGSANPYTFSQAAMDRDKLLMTTEKWQIHHLGQLGEFVGRVFNYQRGQAQLTPVTHPFLFQGRAAQSETPLSLADLTVPPNWEWVLGADTGTFSSALLTVFSPEGDAFVIQEIPNYRYVGGKPELLESMTIPTWASTVVSNAFRCGARPHAWADANSQFKHEVAHYGLTLLSATQGVEARTEITREYFTHGRIFLAPWLSILPFELENAAWPDETTAAGKYSRVKDRDHTLDCLEHSLARRPKGHAVESVPARTFAESVGWTLKTWVGNPHLGAR